MAKNGLVLITKTSFTAQASVSIDNCFSAAYTHYIVKRNLLGSGAGNAINLRLRVGGADASGANYRRQYLSVDSTTAAGGRITGETSFANALGYTEATTFGYSETWISNPFEAVVTTLWIDAGNSPTGNINQLVQVMAHDLTTSYTGFTAYPAAGTITGSIAVYGLVKS